MLTQTERLPRATTGVAGLDDILDGGLARNRLYLLEGTPGTGKTTIALQFLIEGAKLGEAGIYVSLAETERELRQGAKSHGWTIDKEIEVFEHLSVAENVYAGQTNLGRGPPGRLLPRPCADRACDAALQCCRPHRPSLQEEVDEAHQPGRCRHSDRS